MLLAQRKELHGRAARAILQSYRGDPSGLSEILAVHYEIAGDRDEAFQCLMEAGARAKSVFAHHEAINYYRRALKLAIEMGITGAMIRDLYEGLGDAYAVAAKYSAALEHFDQALALPQSALRRAALYRKKGQVLERSGQYDNALRSFKEALLALQSVGDLTEWARACSGLSRVCYQQGKHHTSIELSCIAREIMERAGDSWGVALACNNLGLAYSKVGEQAKALEHFQRALSIWEERNDSVGLSATLNNLGQYHHQRGEYRSAIVKYLQSVELCKQNGNRHGLATAYDNLGQSLALDGRAEEAHAYLARAVAILSDIGSESEEFEPDLWQRSGIW
jgi:tetratricopeptide (TPR) repeat protein